MPSCRNSTQPDRPESPWTVAKAQTVLLDAATELQEIVYQLEDFHEGLPPAGRPDRPRRGAAPLQRGNGHPRDHRMRSRKTTFALRSRAWSDRRPRPTRSWCSSTANGSMKWRRS
jgi:hypothetical protein